MPRPLALGLLAATADRIEERDAQFRHVNRIAEVRVSAGAESLLLYGACVGTAHGDQSEIVVEAAQFGENGKTAVRILSLGVDVE